MHVTYTEFARSCGAVATCNCSAVQTVLVTYVGGCNRNLNTLSANVKHCMDGR